jgi:spore germination protein
MRSERGVVWPYMLLSVALLGALGFGWVQTRQKNQLALDAENKYMSAFHKLKWSSENIEERTSTLMATNDRQQEESLLSDLRVFSAQAVEHMAVLPFATLNTPRIENFLNTLREKTDEYHYKLNQGHALSDEDWTQLVELRKQAVVFEDELSSMLGLVGNNRIRWANTVRVTRPSQNGQAGTPITKSVALMEKALPAPPGEQNAMDPGAAGPLAKPKVVPGPVVDEATARAAIKRFVDLPLKDEPKLTNTVDPKDQLHQFSLYYFSATKANGTPLSFAVSYHGGHVIFMLDGRPVLQKTLTREQLIDKARGMLAKWGYPSVELISVAENDGTQVIEFGPRENGVIMQTDSVKVMLTMDNGELAGFDARNYWINRHPRQFPKPRLSAAEAVKKIAPRLKVEGEPTLVEVADRRSKERLAWEVKAGIDSQRYRIFVDAETGEEINILRVVGDPAPPLNEGQQR